MSDNSIFLFDWQQSPPYLSRQILSINDHKNVKVVLKVLTAKSFSELGFCVLLKNEEEEEDGFLDLQT